jgi:hypothetical protein
MHKLTAVLIALMSELSELLCRARKRGVVRSSECSS